MKLGKAFLSAALVLAMLITMSSFALADGEGALRIGVMGPYTGPAANYGNAVAHGAEIAAAEINALGGLQIELNLQDDEHDAEKAVNAYNNLLDWNVQIIDGPTTTTPCIAVGAEAFNDRVFLLTPSASSPDVTKGNDNVYQVCFDDLAMGTVSAQYMHDHDLAKKVAVIYNNADAYSTGIFQTFEASAPELGIEIVSVSTFTDDTTDFSVQVTEARESGADLVYLPIYYTPAYNILQQAKAQGFETTFFGVDGMDGILGLENIDTSLVEGVMLLTPFDATSSDPRVQSFVEKYRAEYNEEPNQFAADSYDAIYVLYEAAQKAGITPETTWEEACELLIPVMQELSYDGITGSMTWEESGAVSKVPTCVKIVDGKYVSAE